MVVRYQAVLGISGHIDNLGLFSKESGRKRGNKIENYHLCSLRVFSVLQTNLLEELGWACVLMISMSTLSNMLTNHSVM